MRAAVGSMMAGGGCRGVSPSALVQRLRSIGGRKRNFKLMDLVPLGVGSPTLRYRQKLLQASAGGSRLGCVHGGIIPSFDKCSPASACQTSGGHDAATTFRPNSVWIVNRPANSPVLIADLARHPILWKNVFFRRDWNEKPHVPDGNRPCDTFWWRLWGEPRQPIRSIPETVEVIRGAASDAVARRVWNPGCNFG